MRSSPDTFNSFRAYRNLLFALLQRDIRERYLGTATGLLWAFFGPALTLLIYSFVFQILMKVPLPTAASGGFVPFLALGLWPWYAFSDAVSRGTGAMVANAPLLGKIAVPRFILVLVPVLSSFTIHLLGFSAVLLALALAGVTLNWPGMPVVLLYLAAILVLSIGLSLWLATLNVFLRDVSAILPQILTFWMLITPIFFYSGSRTPELVKILSHNPMMAWVEGIRAQLLPALSAPPVATLLEAGLVSILILVSGIFVFSRSAHHFEDYL